MENQINSTENKSEEITGALPIQRIELLVRNSTNVGALAGCIKSNYDKFNTATIVLRYIGAAAGQQAIKSVIIVNQWLSSSGKICKIHPSFGIKKTDEETITVIELNLKFDRIN